MAFELVPLLLALWFALVPPLRPAAFVLDRDAIVRALSGAPAFRPQSREVTNWRIEAASHLAAPPAFALSVLAGQMPAAVSRCVKLNNYWCIKRAGWAGEIAADGEGHVAFASAAEGARTAALLLRRYYVDFGHRTAIAIVSHWAPAQCGIYAGGRAGLAVRGIGGTLRARWLAAHRGGGRVAVRAARSVIPDHSLRMMRTPTIEAGVTEVSLSAVDIAALSLSPLTVVRPAARLAAAPSGGACPSESQRIAGYAVRAMEGLAKSPNDDLRLFDADGRSTPALARIMANMAAVEIGPLKADAGLIAAAIDRVDTLRAPKVRDRAAVPGLPSPPR